MVKVSILVPVYKVPEKFLRQCIESCINQTFRDIEIVLVDDGSPDDCGQICDGYSAADSRVKVIHKPNGGVSDARNAALDVAEGEYVYFLDADDWLEENIIEFLTDLIEKEKADLVACNHYYNDGDGEREREAVTDGEVRFTAENIGNLKYDMVSPEYDKRLNGIVTGATRGIGKLYKASVIRRNGLRFDSNLKIGEDAIFNLNYLKYVSNVIFRGEYLFHYRVFGESANRRARGDIVEIRLALLAAYLGCFTDDRSHDFYLCYTREVLSCIVNCLKKRICHKKFNLSAKQRAAETRELLSDEKITLCWEHGIDKSFFTFSERVLIYLARKKRARLLNFLVKFI